MAIINAPFCSIVWYKVFKCRMMSRHADFYQVLILAPGAMNYVIFYPNQIPASKLQNSLNDILSLSIKLICIPESFNTNIL